MISSTCPRPIRKYRQLSCATFSFHHYGRDTFLGCILEGLKYCELPNCKKNIYIGYVSEYLTEQLIRPEYKLQ